jgi:hypothetical protein
MVRLTLIAVLVGTVIAGATGTADAANKFFVVGDGTLASCTETALRNALAMAETRGGGFISFQCGAGPAVITISGDETPLVVPDKTEIDGGGVVTLQGPPAFAQPQNLVVVAAGSKMTLTALGIFNAWRGVRNDGDLILNNTTVGGAVFADNVENRSTGTLTIVNSLFPSGVGITNGGTMVVRDSDFINNFGRHNFGCFFGGAICNSGTAVIENSRFSGNSHDQGWGGSIGNLGTMKIRRTSFENGFSLRGGAIYNAGTLTIDETTITGANGGSSGGGIFNDGGDLTVRNSIITENRAAYGGGIFSGCFFFSCGGGGTLTLINTSITNNSTPSDGGGIFNGRPLTATDSTISQNTAQRGGGIYNCVAGDVPPVGNCDGSLTLRDTSVTQNTPDDIFP